MMRMHARYIYIMLVFTGCATLGSEALEDNDALPTTGVGPFRKLAATEVGGVAPYVLDSQQGLYREPSALALDGADQSGIAPSTRVALYFVAHPKSGGGDVIERTHADDARSFYGAGPDFGHSPSQVLSADQAWEGSNLAGPSVLAVGAQIYLYYAGIGGIGVAESSDGFAFTKQPGPIFSADASVGWETSTPRAPSVAILPSGEFRMFYAAGACIGEASSTDGVHFTRLDSDPSTPRIDPVLCPSAPVSADAIDAGAVAPIDNGGVDDPLVLPRVTPAGRLQIRVLYTGYATPPGAANRPSAIGFAARYGESGPLVRAAAGVYSANLHEHAPAYFAWSTGSMLYVTEDESGLNSSVYPALAGAFAPAQDSLPAPTGYADSP
jgi:hypothetical protein